MITRFEDLHCGDDSDGAIVGAAAIRALMEIKYCEGDENIDGMMMKMVRVLIIIIMIIIIIIMIIIIIIIIIIRRMMMMMMMMMMRRRRSRSRRTMTKWGRSVLPEA